jgi:flagellar hook-associated protein 3 FlgL
MQYSGLGDLARYFASSKVNHDIRARLETLSQELATGLKSDPSRELGTEAGRVTQLDRKLSLVGRQASSGYQIADRLTVMQASLDKLSNLSTTLIEQLSSLSQSSGNAWREEASQLGRVAIEDAVAALNIRFANSYLFSGVGEEMPSLAPAEDIIDAIRIEVAGATSGDALVDAIDDWFLEPGGGFELIAYKGDVGDPVQRRIDDLVSIRIDVRADDQAIRELLKSAALAFFSDDASIPLSDAERDSVVARATEVMFGATSALAELGGRLGRAEQRVDEAVVRLVAEQTSLSIMQGDLLGADPFETASALEQVQFQLETHYAVTARLSQLSLTRYL